MKNLFVYTLILACTLLLVQCSKENDDSTPSSGVGPAPTTKRKIQLPPSGMVFPKVYNAFELLNEFKAWYRNTDITSRTSPSKLFNELNSDDALPKLIFTTPTKLTAEGEGLEVLDVFFSNDTLFWKYGDDLDSNVFPIAIGNYNQFQFNNYELKIQQNNFHDYISSHDIRITKAILLEEAQQMGIVNPDTIAYWNREIVFN